MPEVEEIINGVKLDKLRTARGKTTRKLQPTGTASQYYRGDAEHKDLGFRPLTRVERRNLWLKEYGEQDFAIQMWVRLVEQQIWRSR